MELAVPRIRLARRHVILLAVVGLSCGITTVMSLLFHGRVMPDMLATGFICALLTHKAVARVTGHYRKRLAEANRTLEARVCERTAELEQALVTQGSLRDELMVRDRMATAGMLAAGVSHEIRSPLSVIRIGVDVIGELAGTDPDPGLAQVVADMTDSADRIALILRDLSSIARPVDDPLTAIELDEVIASAARLAAYKLGPGVTLERTAVTAPAVHGNAPRLVQLVLNLLVNAARATRAGSPNRIVVGAEQRGDRVVLSVSDTGTGMSAETRARLFEPFFTTGADRGGTGLGLTISRSIVERMGGSISIDSALGEGTTVEASFVIAG